MNLRILLLVLLGAALPASPQDNGQGVAVPDVAHAASPDTTWARQAAAPGCGPRSPEPGSPRMRGVGRDRVDLPYGAGYEARQRGFGPGGRGYGRRR